MNTKNEYYTLLNLDNIKELESINEKDKQDRIEMTHATLRNERYANNPKIGVFWGWGYYG